MWHFSSDEGIKANGAVGVVLVLCYAENGFNGLTICVSFFGKLRLIVVG